MGKVRKFSRATRVVLSLFSSVLLAGFGGMAVVARNTAANAYQGVELPAGAVVYDSAYTPVTLTEAAQVRKNGTGQYILTLTDGQLPLGNHSVAYTGS